MSQVQTFAMVDGATVIALLLSGMAIGVFLMAVVRRHGPAILRWIERRRLRYSEEPGGGCGLCCVPGTTRHWIPCGCACHGPIADEYASEGFRRRA